MVEASGLTFRKQTDVSPYHYAATFERAGSAASQPDIAGWKLTGERALSSGIKRPVRHRGYARCLGDRALALTCNVAGDSIEREWNWQRNVTLGARLAPGPAVLREEIKLGHDGDILLGHCSRA